MMKATVIINTNNQNAFLKRAIHSAINQKYSNYEVIISNLSKKKDIKTEKEFKNNKKIKFLNLNEKSTLDVPFVVCQVPVDVLK